MYMKRGLSSQEKKAIDRLYQLVWPTEYLAETELVVGRTYWVYARNIGEVAMCTQVARSAQDTTATTFIGFNNHVARPELLCESYRHPVEALSGTVRPYVAMPETPDLAGSEQELLAWFIQQEQQVNQWRTDWLQAMPPEWRASTEHAMLLESCAERHANLTAAAQNIA